jgi:hypothetical protein
MADLTLCNQLIIGYFTSFSNPLDHFTALTGKSQ